MFERISIDSRTIKPGEAFVAVKGQNFDGHDFIAEAVKKGAAAVIVREPGVGSRESWKVPVIPVKDTIKALGDLARAKRNKFDIPLIAVTGSNGKTTVKDMIAWVLSGKFNVLKNEGTQNNHIGLPMTLLKLNKDTQAAVLELGTNHFGEIEYLARIAQPNIAVITNIGPSHLEFFHDLKGVLREKYTLVKNLNKPGIAILNADDRLLGKIGTATVFSKKTVAVPILSFGTRKSDFWADAIHNSGGKVCFRVNKKYKFTLNTIGGYNIYNALAAIAVARLFGLSYSRIALRLSSFVFPEGRLNTVERGRIKFIDDTYNANPLSLKEALAAFAKLPVRGRKIVVMGDMLELGVKEDFFHLEAGRQIARACDCFIGVGRRSMLAVSSAKAAGLKNDNIFSCSTAQEARDILFKRIAVTGDDVVLVKGSRSMKMEQVFA